MAGFGIGILDRLLMAVRHAEDAETKEYNEAEKSKRLEPANPLHRQKRALASGRLQELEAIKAMVANIRKNSKDEMIDPTQAKKLDEAHKFLFEYEGSKAKLEPAMKMIREVDAHFATKH